MVKVLVETTSTFRIRYVVECQEPEHALDEVVCQMDTVEFQEFSQKHIGQQILSHRVIDDAEYIRIFDEDNDYLRYWHEEKKFQFVNKVDYDNP